MDLTTSSCTDLNTKLLKEQDPHRLCKLLEPLERSDARNKLQILGSTKLSKTVMKLTKNADTSVAGMAQRLVDKWRALCSKPKDGQTPIAKQTATAAVPVPMTVEPEVKPQVKAEVKLEVKPEDQDDKVKVEAKPSAKQEVGSSSIELKTVRRNIALTGDSTRDLVRQKLREVFDKGVKDHEAKLREFDADTAQMAEECESELFEKLDGGGKEYKTRFRSLLFNLRDTKNPDFILSVVSGARHVTDLATLDVKEMASDELKVMRTKWLENSKMSLMDEKSYNKYSGKKVEDGILKCPKCKSMKTEYVEVQTRSADEPTTKKCFCNDCTYRWKFC